VLTLVYLCGPPGAGKSALMAALTARCDRQPCGDRVPCDILFRGGRPVGCEVGRRRPGFPGTDALSMSIAPAAREWIAAGPYRLVLGEGARLASLSFLLAARDGGGYRVHLVHLDAPQAILEARRARRGSSQAEAWARGRATAAANLAQAAESAGMGVARLGTAGSTAGELAVRLMADIGGLGVLA
jgi:P-loop Nucleotide Kinase3